MSKLMLRAVFAALMAMVLGFASPAAASHRDGHEAAEYADDDRDGRNADRDDDGKDAKDRDRDGDPDHDGDERLAPNGDNGTIHTSVEGCVLTVSFYGFDTGANDVKVTLYNWPPTGDREVLQRDAFSATFPARENGNTFDVARTYTVPGEHHVKVVAEVTNRNGTARKSKVEWIRCADAAAAGSARAAGSTASPVVEESGAAAAGGSARRAGGEAARLAFNDDGTEVMGTQFERGDTPLFAFTGAGLTRLLGMGLLLISAGGAMLLWRRNRLVAE